MSSIPDVLKEIARDVHAGGAIGTVASYIPPLARVDPDQFGMCVYRLDGETHDVGDARVPFSIQSVSKVFTTAMVLSRTDILLWKRVGVEPSGTAFNSLVQLETEHGIPRNPLINAGAIVVADELCGLFDDPKQAILSFVRDLSGDDSVEIDDDVAHAERDTGFTNRALANFLKARGNLHHDVEEVLDLYFHQCAIVMDVRALARSFSFLANRGRSSLGQRVLSEASCRRLNAVMLTCGFYDQAGEFAYRVGLPGKSGVGGGIAAIVPGEMSIAVWSPRLNRQGNSAFGVRALETFTSRMGVTVF